MSPRNKTVDVAKALGILLVIVGHNHIVEHGSVELYIVLSSFRMPLFFFVAGVFLTDSKSFGEFALKKADALLKPYFIVMLAVGIVLVSVNSISGAKYFARVAYANGHTIAAAAGPAMLPLWFLPCLFVTVVSAWMILQVAKRVDNKPLFLALSVVVLLAVGIRYLDHFRWADPGIVLDGVDFLSRVRLPWLPFSLDLVGISAGFMLMGYLMRYRVRSMKYDPFLFFVVLSIFAALHYLFDESMDLNKRYYGSWLIVTVQALSGIYIVVSLSELIARISFLRRALAYIGSSSLFLLMFHNLFQYNIFNFLDRVSGMTNVSALVALAAGVLFPLVLVEIAKRQRVLSALLLPMKPNALLQGNSATPAETPR